MEFFGYHELVTVLSNGETELEFVSSKHGCGVYPGKHLLAADGYGNVFIDGKPAHIVIKERT